MTGQPQVDLHRTRRDRLVRRAAVGATVSVLLLVATRLVGFRPLVLLGQGLDAVAATVPVWFLLWAAIGVVLYLAARTALRISDLSRRVAELERHLDLRADSLTGETTR